MEEKIREKTLFDGEFPEGTTPAETVGGADTEAIPSHPKIGKVRPTLTCMEVGDAVGFPILQLKSVRAQASELGLIHARRYQTRVDKEARVVTVTRTA